MSAMGSVIGMARFELGLDLRPFNIGLGAAKGSILSLQTVTAKASGVMNQVLGAAFIGAPLAGLAALAAGIYKGVGTASNLAESVNKVKEIFGAAAPGMIAQAQDLADRFGAIKGEVLDAAAGFGLMGTAAGMGQEAAAGLGKEFTQLGIDLASFHNLTNAQAFEKLRAGLAGEAEPLRAIGILLSEDAVKAEAFATGLAKGHKELTQQEKVLARASLIKRMAGPAVGDRARTEGSAQNQEKTLGGRLVNLMGDVGEAVMPVWQEVLGQLGGLVTSAGAFFTRNKEVVAGWAGVVRDHVKKVASSFWDVIGGLQSLAASPAVQQFAAGAVAAFQWYKNQLTDVIDAVGFFGRNWRDVMELVGVNASAGFDRLSSITGAFMDWFGDNWHNLWEDAKNWMTTVLGNAFTNYVDFFQRIQGMTFEDITKGIAEELAGGKPFVFKAVPLMQGMKPFKAAPFHVPGEDPAFADQRKEIEDRIAENERLRNAGKGPATLGDVLADMVKGLMGKAEGEAGEGGGGAAVAPAERPQQATHSGLEEYAKRIQESAFDKDIARRQLAAQEEQLAWLKDNFVPALKALKQGPGLAAGPA